MMGTGYLYELKEDPYELCNLWDNENYSQIKMEMLQLLVRNMMRAEDSIPVPHNRYRTKVHPKGYWNEEYISEDPGVGKMKSIGNHS